MSKKYTLNQVGDVLKVLHSTTKELKRDNTDLDSEVQQLRDQNYKLKKGLPLHEVEDANLNSIMSGIMSDLSSWKLDKMSEDCKRSKH